eukprot:s825_g8.t3
MPDAQILLARVPGGKRTKELGLVVPIPEEDGLTDGQIAALFVVALVGLIAAVDLAKTLYFGINPTNFFFSKTRLRRRPHRGRDMARSLMAKCLALAAAAVALFALPSAFVPARQGAPAVSPAVAAGVAAGSMALPAWAYDMPDAQILLARVPGGKRTKELGLVVPIPEEDGLTDGQIAALFVVALVGLIAAVDLAKTLYFGINPTKFKTAKGKGSITPFMKRLIENGY